VNRHGTTLARRVPAAPAPRPDEPSPGLPSSLWPVAGIRWLGLVVLVAGVVLAIAWYGCSGETTWHVQVRWFGLGVLACALNAVGCLLWLAAGLRSLRRERAWTTAELRRRDLLPVRPTVAAVPVAGDLVTAARMRRHHRGDCPLMAGKQAVPAPPGLAPCGVCASGRSEREVGTV
jgi:hypothetical protein